MHRKLFSSLSLMLALILMLSACGGSSAAVSGAPATSSSGSGTASASASGRKTSKDTLVIATPVDPGNLKMDNTTTYTLPFFYNLYETLFRTTADGTYTNVLAESYTVDTDNMGVTFKIKKGVKFNNGDELKASDILFSTQMALKGGFASNIKYLDMAKSTAVDDYTVHFAFNTLYGPWQEGIRSINIFSEKAFKSADETAFWLAPVTTGPYMIEKWVSGDSIALKRFDTYWDGPAILKTIRFRVISESSVAKMELETGGVDLIYNVSNEEVKSVKNAKDSKITIYTQIGSVGNYMGMNNTKKALSDIRVRQALAYAIDRQALIDGAYDGAATLNDGIMGPSNIGYSNKYAGANYPYKYDTAKAKQLLGEAGFGSGLSLTLVTDSGAARLLMAEQLNKMFKEVGVTLNIKQYDFATATDILNNTTDFDLYLRGANINNGEALSILTAPPIYNLCRMSVLPTEGYTEWKKLLDEIQATAQVEKRIELYKTLQDNFLSKWFFWCPTITPNVYMLHTSNLAGFVRITDTIYYHDAYFK